MFLIFILYFHVKKEEKYQIQIHSPKKSQHKKNLLIESKLHSKNMFSHSFIFDILNPTSIVFKKRL